MQKTHLRTYANHVRSALVHRRDSLKTELAVMFAVMIESDGNRRLARESIYAVYNATGSYQCEEPVSRDWKAVGRVINAAFALWDFIGEEDIAKWSDGLKSGELVSALAEHIAPLKLATVNEVLTICDKVKPKESRASNARSNVTDPKGSFVCQTEHARIVIPPSVSAAELMTIINALMKHANSVLDAGNVSTHSATRKAA